MWQYVLRMYMPVSDTKYHTVWNIHYHVTRHTEGAHKGHTLLKTINIANKSGIYDMVVPFWN
jgi:hypothetical protein